MTRQEIETELAEYASVLEDIEYYEEMGYFKQHPKLELAYKNKAEILTKFLALASDNDSLIHPES